MNLMVITEPNDSSSTAPSSDETPSLLLNGQEVTPALPRGQFSAVVKELAAGMHQLSIVFRGKEVEAVTFTVQAAQSAADPKAGRASALTRRPKPGGARL